MQYYRIALKFMRFPICLGTCQKLAGGEGRWNQGEGHIFFSSQKGEGQKKLSAHYEVMYHREMI